MDYRREIDGLRAVAIVPVVLFHAGFGVFTGGFVGVDVFFVISGYLITSIILTELKAGEFSLARFYERRIRRLLPALFFVILVSSVFAVLWLLPGDLEHFFKSVSYAALFASNYRFYRIKDYFAPEADLQPLVHTWSLAIEEQYYLLFPLAMILLHRFAKSALPWAIAAVGVASFILCQRKLGSDASAAFFLTPFRVWELMLGSLIASLVVAKRISITRSEAGAWAGLALITGSALLMSEQTPFPGFYALVPTIGAALVILFATSDTLAGRLLGSRAFVGIGLVSYSAYLWHQPIFAFAKLRFGDDLGPAWLATLVLGVFALSWATWRYVEQPFRRARSQSKARLFAVAGGATLVIFALGHVAPLIDKHGLRGERYGRIEALFRGNDGLDRVCRDEGWALPKCRTSDKPEVLVWGDSYAMHLVQGFTATDDGKGVMQATKGACPPIFGIAPYEGKRPASWSRQCLRQNERVAKLIQDTPSLKYVALSSFFTSLTAPHARVMTADGAIRPASGVALDAFVKSLDAIKAMGPTPVVFAPPPQDGRNHGRCVANAMLFGGGAPCTFELAEAKERQRHIRDFLKAVEARGHLVVYLDDAICPGGVCAGARDATPIYRDSGHLTVDGSRWLGRTMRFSDALRAGQPM